jgi:DNA replicative helicase MCM subunit Mcm2 (Cdc46/Mcm family)
MNLNELTFQEVSNCRIQSKIESYTLGRVVTWQEVANREIAKALSGKIGLVSIKDYDESTDNIGKYIFLEFSDGDYKRVLLQESLDSINANLNVISTNSPVGKHLKYAKVNELIQVNGTILRVVDITKTSLDATN